jgi:hypothetical protein
MFLSATFNSTLRLSASAALSLALLLLRRQAQ